MEPEVSEQAESSATQNSSRRRNRDSSGSQVSKEVGRIERRLSKKATEQLEKSNTQDKTEGISSWLQEPVDNLVDPNLPLTPPSLPRDSEEEPVSAIEDEHKTPEQGFARTVVEQQQVPTPVAQRSPPTPDQTPPRARYPQNGLNVPSTATLSLRYPSSTAESFKTAQEVLSSQEEIRSVTTHRRGDSTSGNAVVGLGFEMSEGSGTPTVRESSVIPKIRSLDGSWGEDPQQIMDDPFVASESVAIQQFQQSKRTRRRRKRDRAGSNTSPVPDDYQASLDRAGFEGDDDKQDRDHSSQSSIDKFAEQIQWPTENDGLEAIHVDQKRLSELSNQSQVVQAVVVSTPPQRRRKLRHSSKNESLRTAGSPLNGSNRSSYNSNGDKSRLQQPKTKVTERKNRISGNSDSGVSMGSDALNKLDESLPASEIPQRRSSLRSSKRKLPDLRSMVEAQRNKAVRRPDTAPDHKLAPAFEPNTSRRPATSDANEPAPLHVRRGKKPKDAIVGLQPRIPQRSSSLSAPTSRNNSRTTSLTSTSLHKHNLEHSTTHLSNALQQIPLRRNVPREVTIEAAEPRASQHLSVDPGDDKRASDDMSTSKHRSILTTPFSIASMHSSTPGPYELDVATAIEIYPHNNTSVLVVQQLPPRHGSELPRLSASLSGNVRINLEGFHEPPKVHERGRSATSPLKDPRDAPRPPPPVVLIPPTPANADSSAPPSRGRRSATSSNASGPFSTLRRALSARRYSESAIARPFISLSRGNSVKAPRTRQRGESESKPRQFSGFWNPRGFWNDLSDDEEDDQRAPTTARTSSRSNSLVRRFGSLRSRQRVGSAVNESDGTYVSYGRTRQEYPIYNPDMDAIGYEDVERKVGILSRIRNTKVKPFTSMHEAIRDMKQRRVEEQLERQRERLRKNIGPVILQKDAVPFFDSTNSLQRAGNGSWHGSGTGHGTWNGVSHVNGHVGGIYRSV